MASETPSPTVIQPSTDFQFTSTLRNMGLNPSLIMSQLLNMSSMRDCSKGKFSAATLLQRTS